eukprot:UN02362
MLRIPLVISLDTYIPIFFTHGIQKGRIQKENPKSKCLTVTQLTALAS